MVLRTRVTLKVVWRSGKHLRRSFGKGNGKAQEPGRQDASGPRGVGGSGRQKRGRPGSRGPRTSAEKMQRPQEPSRPRGNSGGEGAGAGRRVARPGSRRSRAHSGNRDAPYTSAGLRCGTAGPPELGRRRRRGSAAGATHPRRGPRCLRSRPAPGTRGARGRAACPLALGRGGARRGGRRKSRSGARAPGRPAEAGRGAARCEPGKDAPGGAGGAGARGGVAEPAESRAADVSAHPRPRLRSPRTSAAEAGPSRHPEAREGRCGRAEATNGSSLARRRL